MTRKRQADPETIETLRAITRKLRRQAVQEFRLGVEELLRVIDTSAHEIEASLGEYSLDEGWAAMERACTRVIHRHCHR